MSQSDIDGEQVTETIAYYDRSLMAYNVEFRRHWYSRHIEKSKRNYDPYEYIYDWPEEEEGYILNDYIKQFVWQEWRK
jgi:hypothetical protein